MPQCCAVPLCSEKKGGHKFPKDKTVSKQWLVAIRRENYTPSKHSRVCKKHFNPEDYALPKDSNTENPIPKLKPNTVPSRFSWNHESDERKEIKRKRAETALERQKICETSTLCSNTEENQKNTCEHHFTFEVKCEEIDIEDLKTDVLVQCSLCKCDESLTNTTNLSEHESNRERTQERTLSMFRIENLKDKPDVVQFYTGFDNYNHFMSVFNLFGDEVNNLKYYSSLTPSNQFFLTLIKLRRNMCFKELSLHFEISITSVSKYFKMWVNYLYCKFKEQNVWVPKETIDENETNQKKSNNCIVIIDCTETKIDKQHNPVSQQATYSKYISANMLKVLVRISSSGSVTFVSDAYGVSISDKELLEKCGIINSLLNRDVILSDRSFDDDDDVTVNMPQKKGSDQCEANQLRKSKQLSSIHVNVERVTGLGKTFKVLNNKLSSNSVAFGGRILFVCFMLAKFRKNM